MQGRRERSAQGRLYYYCDAARPPGRRMVLLLLLLLLLRHTNAVNAQTAADECQPVSSVHLHQPQFHIIVSRSPYAAAASQTLCLLYV